MLHYPLLTLTQAQGQQIDKINFLAKVLQTVPISSQLATHIFHRQLLKSSLFSANIEGNTLTFSDVSKGDLVHSSDTSKQEIANVMRALEYAQNITTPFTQSHLLEIHRQVMSRLHEQAGKFRSESSAIYDRWGNVVYLTPSPEEMEKMLEIWLKNFDNNGDEKLGFHRILAAHYYFEKTHPFLDGNGRTGRVLLQYHLNRMKLFGDFVIPIEEYFDNRRLEYYAFLEKNSRDIENFVNFFLEGIIWSLEKVLDEIKTVGENFGQTLSKSQSKLDLLLPRRQEMFFIIQDHPYISMDLIARRFPTISRRTLAYDLQWLVKHHYVIKHGSTRGARYSVVS